MAMDNTAFTQRYKSRYLFKVHSAPDTPALFSHTILMIPSSIIPQQSLDEVVHKICATRITDPEKQEWPVIASYDLTSRLRVLDEHSALKLQELVLKGTSDPILHVSDISRTLRRLPALRKLHLEGFILHSNPPNPGANFSAPKSSRIPMTDLIVAHIAIQKHVDTKGDLIGSSLDDVFSLFSDIQVVVIGGLRWCANHRICSEPKSPPPPPSPPSNVTIQKLETTLPEHSNQCGIGNIWNALANHQVLKVVAWIELWPFTSLLLSRLNKSPVSLELVSDGSTFVGMERRESSNACCLTRH